MSMDASGDSSDIQRELDHLRERAYGPAPDIAGDPTALARLDELQNEHRQPLASTPETDVDAAIATPDTRIQSPTAPAQPGDVAPQAATATGTGSQGESVAESPAIRKTWRQRILSRRGALVLLAVVAGLTTVALAYGANWMLTPRPAAILQATATRDDGGTGADRWLAVSSAEDQFMTRTVDRGTLAWYGAFHGVAVGSALDEFGNACLLLFEESNSRPLDIVCAPRSGELIADIGVWPLSDHDFHKDLPAGSVIRFRQQGATVEVFLFEGSGAR